MSDQMTFQRYEMKYMLTRRQRDALLNWMKPYMALDQFGHSTIRNIYYDTDTFRLIRRSLEKPVYKEKLRVRSYAPALPEDPVFVELKKKYRSVVYKRRMALPQAEAMAALRPGAPFPADSQIAREIGYFRDYYGALRPAVFLSYEREAYGPLDGGDFRLTLDENILYREEDLSLASDPWGSPLLDRDQVLLELKVSGGIPLWMTRFLTRQRIGQTSFSKYGAAYESMLLGGGRETGRILRYA